MLKGCIRIQQELHILQINYDSNKLSINEHTNSDCNQTPIVGATSIPSSMK